MRFKLVVATAALLLAPGTLAAQPIDPTATERELGALAMLRQDERRAYAELFALLEQQQWDRFEQAVSPLPDSPLKGFALAEYYTHANSPRIELPAIEAWLARYPYLPQAEQLVRLGQRRGLEQAPALPRQNQLTRQRSVPKRMRPPSVGDGTMPQDVADAINVAIRDDDPDSARILLEGIDANLSSAARAEWRQKVAWSYYIENRDSAALQIARLVPQGGSGAWIAEGEFTRGLAAWRLGDCREALAGFSKSARAASNSSLRVAAQYWAGRSAARCRQPELATRFWREASTETETLYGLLAREQLGLPPLARPESLVLSEADIDRLRREPNAGLAIALTELGQDDLAEEVLQHQARIGDPSAYPRYAGLARALGLARAQIWLAYNVPRGATPEPNLRFPVINDRPVEGWQVDPSLAFAHALQESDFRHRAVSPANAIGLMQVRPIAARDVDDRTQLAAAYADLKDPATNLSFGQANLAKLGSSSVTGGLLPKVMAAYNAGSSPVARWNSEVRDGGDPLLWMESIPYWETRSYVAIVMRNYWIYQQQAGAAQHSKSALAQNRWPTFPDLR